MNEPILTSNVISIQPRIVRRELNLDFGQFFYPQETKKIFVSRLFLSELTDEDGNKKTIKAEVSFHPKYGTLTTFDERVFYVLVEFWQEQGKPETVYFSDREIARQLNVKWGGESARRISESLTRLRLVGIEWNGSFFHKLSDSLISISNPFTILSHLKTFTTKNEGIGSQIAEFRFDDRVVDNLNSNYSRPTLLDTVISFCSPLAQALYIYLEPRLYGTNHYNRTSAGLFIEDLGLQGSIYSQKKYRVRAIKRAREELLGKRFYYDEAITKIEIANGKQDAIFHAYRSGAPKLKGRVIEMPHEAAPKKEPKRKKSQNCHKAPSNNDNPTTTSKTQPRASQDVYELLQLFTRTFYDQEQQFSKQAVAKAQEVIKQHGMERAKFFVRFAKAEATKTNYKPQHIQGIIKYLEPAIAEYERQQRTAKKGEDDAARRRLENAKIDHERNYESEYFNYLDEVVVRLMDKQSERFNEFRTWQNQERTKIVESTMSDGIKKIQLRTFDSEGAAILRLQRFFHDDSEIHIPSFWEWDEQHNPNRFGYSRRV